MKKRQISMLFATGIVAVTIIQSPLISFAARSPEFARTAEEWARLKDDVLEYEEIEDLIYEYNVTVQNNYADWRGRDFGMTTEDMVRAAENAVQGLYDTAAGAGTEVEYITIDYQTRMAEAQLQNTINNAEDETTKRLQYEKIEKSLVVEAQTAMNTYYQLQYQLTSAQKSRQLMESAYSMSVRQQSLGTASYTDVLNAQQGMQNADVQILSLENQIETVRKKLIVMLGWGPEAYPEIRPMPALDLNRLNIMNPAADIETAYANDYTLRIDQRKVLNSLSDTGRIINSNNVENDKQQIAVALNNAYQSVLQAKNAYDQAQLEWSIASKSHTIAAARQQVGMGSAFETLQAEVSAVSAEANIKVQELALFQAMETYDWVLKGVR